MLASIVMLRSGDRAGLELMIADGFTRLPVRPKAMATISPALRDAYTGR